MTDKSTPNPKRISSKDYCKTPSCRKRGTHKNHTHSECKFKESNSTTKHPNLGSAPAKKQRNAKTNSSQPAKNAFTPPAKSDERKCYTCGKPGHLSNACPDKGRIKAGAQSSLNKNKSFMALWQSAFIYGCRPTTMRHTMPQIMGRRCVLNMPWRIVVRPQM